MKLLEQQPKSVSGKHIDKTIGFTFSGGGARAIAQIGALRAFQEHGIRADYVAGTSGGSIIGAMYAAGVSIEKMMELAHDVSAFKVYTPGVSFKGFTSLDYLRRLFDQTMETDDFAALKIPFAATATNLMTGNKENINHGSISRAVMASCAVPLLFKPVKIGENYYVDGGITDNLPVEFLLENGCDCIIGVDVMPNTPLLEEGVNNFFSIGMRVFHIVTADNSAESYSKCDWVVEPLDILNYNLANLKAASKLFQIGYEQTIRDMDFIKERVFG